MVQQQCNVKKAKFKLPKHQQQTEPCKAKNPCMSIYLEVKVGNFLAVHESQSLQDLLHELNCLTLQQVLLLSNEVKQLPSTNPEISNKHQLFIRKVQCYYN